MMLIRQITIKANAVLPYNKGMVEICMIESSHVGTGKNVRKQACGFNLFILIQ